MARAARPVPTRSCVACRTSRAKRDLLRIVRTPAGAIEVDASGRRPGRGAYVCREGSCWQTALDKGLLARALGSAPPAEVGAALEATTTTKTPTTNRMTTMTTGGDKRGEE